MRLICSHMKDSLIESESRFHCLGVSTLTPDSHSALWTTQGLMEAGTLTNTYVNTLAHNVFLRGKCANITSGAFTMEAHENETKVCSSKIPRVLAQTRILQMRILHHRRYTHHYTHAQTFICCPFSHCEIYFLILPSCLPSVHSFAVWARAVGVCQESFQLHSCFQLRALSPVRASALNMTDKASSMPRHLP